VSGKSDARGFLAEEVLDPSDPRVREAEAFPSLTADQVERVCRFGVVQRLPAGTVLFEPGARRVDFFLVLDASSRLMRRAARRNRWCTCMGSSSSPASSTSSTIGRYSSAGAWVAMGAARLNCSQFRRLLAAEPDIANVVIRAII